jgi:hypothetical protein
MPSTGVGGVILLEGLLKTIQSLPSSFVVNRKALFRVLLRTNSRENAENVLYTFYNIFYAVTFEQEKTGL